MTVRAFPLLVCAALATAAVSERGPDAGAGRIMAWADLYGRPRVRPDATLAYGTDPLQHVDLWLPKERGPHPVVLMIHGGCWRTDIAQAHIMQWAADDLRRRGIAVWNVEYRGVDRPGGGYPGTFRDIAAAADLLRHEGPRRHLDMDRVVVVGHSAGGHLALWLAGSAALPAGGPLHRATSLRLAAAVSLGGLPDLEAAAVPPGDTCGPAIVPMLTGRREPGRPDVYADTSPARMPQPAIPITLVNGARDDVAPPATAAAYAARVANPAVRTVTVPGDGHVEEIAPGSASWAVVTAALRSIVVHR